MPVIQSGTDTKKESAADLMHFIFDSCLTEMMSTETYSKYAKIPGLVNMFKKGALNDMKKIETNPKDLRRVELLMQRIFMKMDAYYLTHPVN